MARTARPATTSHSTRAAHNRGRRVAKALEAYDAVAVTSDALTGGHHVTIAPRTALTAAEARELAGRLMRAARHLERVALSAAKATAADQQSRAGSGGSPSNDRTDHLFPGETVMSYRRSRTKLKKRLAGLTRGAS